ncbi:substrate-binding domain-containing protein [Prescottella defluvii]|nr:substrate-binding domain-containing protein [Prescottella defluvii]
MPASSASTERLSTAPGVIDGRPKSIATSPVVLAVPAELGLALDASGTGWQRLPALQSSPDSLHGLGVDGWGSLKLALPVGSPTGQALDAIAVATADAGTGPLDETQAASPTVTAAISALANGNKAIDGAPASTADAINALARQTSPSAGSFHAVPATEQQIYAAGTAASGVTAFAPPASLPSPTTRRPSSRPHRSTRPSAARQPSSSTSCASRIRCNTSSTQGSGWTPRPRPRPTAPRCRRSRGPSPRRPGRLPSVWRRRSPILSSRRPRRSCSTSPGPWATPMAPPPG